ncbi:hypothetical protein XNW1_4630026 [Xenorhabdus nematophila str. Websteri]|nr:hypothetical protein XNA1_4690016 [Xenorhabdus nematophila str. Anatoliense]CEE95507.1 hypothetical protein XNA1_530016 [Xenorhabdus nematophila str. Anatoliense]CEF31821.1 hypothetical protein XNW1_410027 [Xenorhabdus nematophila str. Websteri]CEF33143.1 hypothetical protein XNW1_4630026 [Xenorhabdus nematophila str. Websteri]
MMMNNLKIQKLLSLFITLLYRLVYKLISRLCGIFINIMKYFLYKLKTEKEQILAIMTKDRCTT